MQSKSRAGEESSDERSVQPNRSTAGFEADLSAASNSLRRPGTLIDGRYTIDSLIGVGGMSAVYKVHHNSLGRIAALKIMHTHLLSERVSLQRFILEARTEGALQHPNIVSVHNVGATEDGALYLVMDFVDGISLSRLIREQAVLSAPEAITIFVQICQGLSAAHARSILHRDIKPSNVMLLKDDRSAWRSVKIVDFGLAKVMKSDSGQRLTRAGSILGSPSYMSPEQSQGQAHDCRSDIYSFGCLMYECLTGKVPFVAESEIELLMKHVHQVPPSFDAMAPELAIPASIERIVRKCLEKCPLKRYQSVDALLTDLKSVDLQELAIVSSSNNTFSADKKRVFARSVLKKFGAGKLLTIGSICVLLLLTGGWPQLCALYDREIYLPDLQRQAATEERLTGSRSASAAIAKLRLADAWWARGNEEAASVAYQSAVTAFDKELPGYSNEKKFAILARIFPDQPNQQANALHNITSELVKRHRPQQARPFAEHSVALTKTCDLWTRIVSVSDLASVLAEEGDVAKASAVLASALDADLSEVRFKEALAAILINAGDYALKSKVGDRALKYYNRSLELLEDGSPSQQHARSINYRRIGDCSLAKSDLSQAKVFYQKAVDTHVDFGPSSVLELRENLRVLADVVYALGDIPGAQRHYMSALGLSQDLAVDGTFVSIQKGLADCHYRQQDYVAASRVYMAIAEWLDQHRNYPIDRKLILRQIQHCRMQHHLQHHHHPAMR